jgi:hypothetical protein
VKKKTGLNHRTGKRKKHCSAQILRIKLLEAYRDFKYSYLFDLTVLASKQIIHSYKLSIMLTCLNHHSSFWKWKTQLTLSVSENIANTIFYSVMNNLCAFLLSEVCYKVMYPTEICELSLSLYMIAKKMFPNHFISEKYKRSTVI